MGVKVEKVFWDRSLSAEERDRFREGREVQKVAPREKEESTSSLEVYCVYCDRYFGYWNLLCPICREELK
jgi:hypothetical protein